MDALAVPVQPARPRKPQKRSVAGKKRHDEGIRRWHKAHPESKKASARTPAGKAMQKRSSRKWSLKTLFGLTPEAYQALLLSQNGLCAICKGPPMHGKSLAVDHCHSTQRIRGLLCTACNLAVGNMQDNPARLRAAAEYLEKV